MAEGIQEYIERRAEILRQTTGIAERLSTAWHGQALQMPYRRVNLVQAMSGMGRPYNVIDSIHESPLRILIHRAYLVSPRRRGMLLFTDPLYELTFAGQKIEDDKQLPSLEFTYMGNGEIELGYRDREGFNGFWRSYQLPNVDALNERLNTPTLENTLRCLNLDPLIFQIH